MHIPINKAIRDNIITYTKRLIDHKLAQIPHQDDRIYLEDSHPLYHKVNALIHDLVWGKHIRLKKQIPPQWCTIMEDEQIELNLKISARKFFSIELETGKELYPPMYWDDDEVDERTTIPLHEAPQEIQDLYAEIVYATKSYTQLKNKLDNLYKQIVYLLDTKESVNVIVEEIPAFKEFMPPNIRSALDAPEPTIKKTRKKAPIPKVNINPEELTALAAEFKLKGVNR